MIIIDISLLFLFIKKYQVLYNGKVYQTIMNKEEKSEYLNKTIQIIPHVTNEIIKLILKNSEHYDITICEISDINSNIESMIYMEVIRQLKVKFSNQICIILLTYILFLEKSKKIKTKLSKYSINSLLDFGIKADFIFCKYDKIISKIDFIDKIALYLNISKNRIFLAPNIDNIYKLPYIFLRQDVHKKILKLLNITKYQENFSSITKMYNIINNLQNIIIIKELTYIALSNALKHAAYNLGYNIKFNCINIKNINKESLINLLVKNKYAILVPGGHGPIGIENKITTLNYARINNIPCLGICYGMQLMAIEFARNILNIKNASTEEIDNTNNLIHIVHKSNINGTLRLGNYETIIKPNSIAYNIHNSTTCMEKYMHAYKINTKYIDLFEKNNFIFSGTSEDNKYMAISEIPTLNFYIGVQYHPEFNSSIFNPNKILYNFINKAIKYQFNK
jgi:CTP synthase